MSFFHLDTERCAKDGICSKVCIVGIIKNDENRLPYIDEAKEKSCMACGLCVAFCPHEACYVEKLDKKQFSVIEEIKTPDGSQIDTLLKSRRSVRNFKKTPVDSETLYKVLDTARYSPTAKNSQNIRWTITKNMEETDKIRELMLRYFEETSKVTPAPESVFMKSMIRAYNQGRDVFLRGAPQLAVAVLPKDYIWKEDAAIALTYFEISAFAHGLGTCWSGYYTAAARKYLPLREAMGIGEDEYVGGALMLGNPIYRPKAVPSRNNVKISWI